MSRPIYVAIFATLYGIMFAIIFYVAGPPVTGPVETVVVVAGLSIGLSWLVLWRADVFTPPGWPPYRMPSIIYTLVLIVVAGVTIQTIVGG